MQGAMRTGRTRALEVPGAGPGFHFCRPVPADALAEAFTGTAPIGA